MPGSPHPDHSASTDAAYAYAARPLAQHHTAAAPTSAASPSSTPSSYGSSSSSSNYRPHNSSSSSSLDTSPPSQHGGNSSSVGAYPSLAHFSPSTQHTDLLKIQRDLYHQASYNASASAAAAFPDWPRRHSQTRAAPTTMSAVTSTLAPAPAPAPASTQPPQVPASSSSSSSARASSSPSAAANTHQREELAVTPERGTRGSKSRRASSGGSRIPYEQEETTREHAARGSASGSASSPSGAAATTSTIRSSSSSLSASSSSSRQRPARPSSPSMLVPPPSSESKGAKPLPHVDLATYPSQDLLRVLAVLLHQIATTNDAIRPPSATQDERGRRSGSKSKGDTSAAGQDGDEASSSSGAAAVHHPQGVTTAAMGALGQPSSTLCFHARNVPSITIESYLLRILKYCPTTNDVFLSLIVYLDRMSRVAQGSEDGSSGSVAPMMSGGAAPLTTPSGALHEEIARSGAVNGDDDESMSSSSASAPGSHVHPGMKGFAVDSYNIHRLVIAGVTVASKFFSDVFYTNSRYAKVGGLPVHELNQLELQFLLLNDFRLVIPLPELQSYADRLLVYATGSGVVQTGVVKELGAPGAGEAAAAASGQQRRTSHSSSTSRPAATTPAASSSSSSSTATPHAASSPRPDRSAAAAVQVQEG